MAVQKRCVEQVVDEVLAVTAVKGLLQPLEIRQSIVTEADHLAIEPAVLEFQRLDCLDLAG